MSTNEYQCVPVILTISRHDLEDTISRTRSRRHNLEDTISKTRSRRHDLEDTISKTRSRRHDLADAISKTRYRRHRWPVVIEIKTKPRNCTEQMETIEVQSRTKRSIRFKLAIRFSTQHEFDSAPKRTNSQSRSTDSQLSDQHKQ
jgi:chromosome segregation ATPase